MRNVDRFNAYCNWGMGEDVVILDNWDKTSTMGMSIAQAQALVSDLLCAIAEAERLESECNKYFEAQQNLDPEYFIKRMKDGC